MPQEKAQPTWLKQLVAVEALFLCCVLPWLLSDLWYDEVLSLNVVLLHDSPWEIFRDYRFANNHFLNNFLEWLWLRGLGLNAANEFLVRLPAVFFGMGTVAVVLLGWRKFLGEKIALLTAVVMACSPVFTAFAWQFRGYSLAMFLSALAIHACAIRCQKNTVANGVALFLLGLLLPLVMPPAAMLPCALAVALCAEKGMALRSWMGLWDGVRAAWPPVAGAVLGVALDQRLAGWVACGVCLCSSSGGALLATFQTRAKRRRHGITTGVDAVGGLCFGAGGGAVGSLASASGTVPTGFLGAFASSNLWRSFAGTRVVVAE